MTFPRIGTILSPKRGRKVAPATVLNIYRPDRAVLLDTEGGRKVARMADVRRNYTYPKEARTR